MTTSSRNDTDDPPFPTIFSARLSPSLSLSWRGAAWVVGLTALASLILSVPFTLLGAWPVAGFFGVDVLLLAIAFRVVAHRARAYEEVVLTPVELTIRQVGPKGTAREWRFNPRWVRLERDEHAEFGTQRLALVEGVRRVDVGAFLGAEEKADFAGALGSALATARRS